VIVRRPQQVIFALAILYLVAIRWSLGIHGMLNPDYGRDVATAWRIAHGLHFPLKGPFQRFASDPSTGGVHLGPLFHYLSAVPLFLFGTATSLIVFTSLLSLVGVYFGYKLGELLFCRRVGLVFAALLGADFMATIACPLGGHTALIIPTCLMFLYATFLAILRRDADYIAWAFAAAAIAVQMHLAAVSLLPFLALAIVLPMNGKKTRGVVLGVGLAIAVFLPYLIGEALHGWEDVRSFLALPRMRVQTSFSHTPITALPRLFLRYNQFSASMAIGFSQYVTPRWAWVPVVVCLRLIALASLLGLAMAVLGLFRGEKRAPLGLVIAWLLLGWSIIWLLRPSLPWYVLFPVYPAHLLLASLAITRLAQAGKGLGAWRFVPYGLVGAVFVLSPLLMAGTFSRFAQQGRLEIATWLLKDLVDDPAETPGTWVVPYLGARNEEMMVRRLTDRPETDVSIYQKIHGVPLWSLIFSRASLFLLHPPRETFGEPSAYHFVGMLRQDLPGKPVGAVYSRGPLILIRSLPSIAYERVRYATVVPPLWYEPGYDDSGWRSVTLPGYTLPIPWEFPPRPSITWERSPVYFRARLVHEATSRMLLGASFPASGAPGEYGEVKHIYVNGIELADPSLRSPDLRLYDITTHLKPGENILAVAVEGGAHFVLDLFTVSLES
jgi:hypothetical protein